MRVLYNTDASEACDCKDSDLSEPVGVVLSSVAKALAEEIGWYFGLEVLNDRQLDNQFHQVEAVQITAINLD